MMKHLIFAALIVSLAACAPLSMQVGEERVRRPYSIDRNFIESVTATPAHVTAWYADTTQKTYTRQHGTQISHLAADGRTYLVYPGNQFVLVGEWQARATPERRQICYRYPTARVEPDVTYDENGWRCDPARLSVFMTDQIVDGDPLGLANMTVLPVQIEPDDDVTIEEYAEDLGLQPLNLANRIRWKWRSAL